jgi:hypothetical protein
MKALRINVVARRVEQIDLNPGLPAIYRAIGNSCNCFACPLFFDNGDALYVDDEGLLKKQNGGFCYSDWAQAVAGNALIVGIDESGENIDCKSTASQIIKGLNWLDAYAMESIRELYDND